MLPFYSTAKQPLIIVYQNAGQRDRMKKLATNVVFLDATHKGRYSEKMSLLKTNLFKSSLL